MSFFAGRTNPASVKMIPCFSLGRSPAFSASLRAFARTRRMTTGSVVTFFEPVPLFDCRLCRLPDFGVDFAFATSPPLDCAYSQGVRRLLIMPVAHESVSYILYVCWKLLFLRHLLRRCMPESLMSYRSVMRGKLRSLRGFLHMPPYPARPLSKSWTFPVPVHIGQIVSCHCRITGGSKQRHSFR